MCAAGKLTDAPLLLTVVTETHPPEINGVAMTVGRLVEGLRARSHTVSVVRPRRNGRDRPGPNETLVGGLPLPGYPELRFDMPATGRLRRQWTARRPDAVHIVTEGPLGWSALRAARSLGIPVTSGYHTNFDRYSRHYRAGFMGPAVRGWLSRFHRRTDATLVPTATLANDLGRRGIPGVRVVARGIDTTLFDPSRRDAALREAWSCAPDTLAVLYVGRLAAEKNLALVETAFEMIAARGQPARMIWVGDGPQRERLRRSHPDHHFAGSRVGNDLAAHYASADLFLFASLTETYGNVTVEAMASGLPVVAFDDAAAGVLIRHGETGLLAPPGNFEAFIEAALHAADDADLRRSMGERARARVVPLGWDAIVCEMEQAIRAAIAGRAEAGPTAAKASQ